MPKSYLGDQTRAGLKNFPFSGPRVSRELIHAIAMIKMAAAAANAETGRIDARTARAITAACREVLRGTHDGQFPLPSFQGGAGTSTNMNVNEVVALRATELLARSGKDKKTKVHPNDHVNLGQSTNDVIPSALKIACLRGADALLGSIDRCALELEKKARSFGKILKLGRTHLQDAVPITLGSEFASYAATIRQDRKRVENALAPLYELSLGGTAVGNSVTAPPRFIRAMYAKLRAITRLPLRPGGNLMSLVGGQSDFLWLSQALTLLLADASKISNDLRLLSSGPRGGIGEITLRELQYGSSIMPGKVNPVIPEAVNQAYFAVSGNNLTIEHAVHAAQLELAVMTPIVCDRLLASMILTTEILEQFALRCIALITPNRARCAENLERSTAYATLLTPRLGYDTVRELVKEALKRNCTVRDIVRERGLLSERELDSLMRP